MANPKILQLDGDIRVWLLSSILARTPLIPEANDPDGNQPVEVDAMSLSHEEGEAVTIKSKRRGARYGQTIFQKSQPGQTSISLTLLELPRPLWARVVYGEAANSDITAGSVTDDPFVVTDKASPMVLPHRYVKSSPVPVVKTGATTLVSGTDYVIDFRRGTLLVKAASVDVGDELTLSYSFEAVTSTRFLGGTAPTQDLYITGDMEDRNSTDQGLLEVFQARVSMDGEVDWMSSEPINPVLTGILLTPPSAPAPYTFELYAQAV